VSVFLENDVTDDLPGLILVDVLAVDAFSSDAIPVHLLTREALLVYLRHLRAPDGVLALHISNRYLDLKPVAKGLARELGLQAGLVAWLGQEGVWPSDWILLTRGGGLLRDPQVIPTTVAGPSVREEGLPLWTDNYSNLLSVIKR
jgi:hypothetical protein